jgi:hypothetical protein
VVNGLFKRTGEIIKTINRLRYNTWKKVAIISGDIHMRGMTDIKFEGETMLKQFITSGISIRAATEFQVSSFGC